MTASPTSMYGVSVRSGSSTSNSSAAASRTDGGNDSKVRSMPTIAAVPLRRIASQSRSTKGVTGLSSRRKMPPPLWGRRRALASGGGWRPRTKSLPFPPPAAPRRPPPHGGRCFFLSSPRDGVVASSQRVLDPLHVIDTLPSDRHTGWREIEDLDRNPPLINHVFQSLKDRLE